jgi:hypothetical protein
MRVNRTNRARVNYYRRSPPLVPLGQKRSSLLRPHAHPYHREDRSFSMRKPASTRSRKPLKLIRPKFRRGSRLSERHAYTQARRSLTRQIRGKFAANSQAKLTGSPLMNQLSIAAGLDFADVQLNRTTSETW